MKILLSLIGILIIYNIIVFIYYYLKHKEILKLVYKNVIKINKKYISINNKKYYYIIMFILFIITFIICYSYLNIFIGSIFLSIFISLIPYYFTLFVENKNKSKIINNFPNFLINLKGYCIIKNDIIEAFKRIVVDKPLCNYVEKFNYSINSGVPISECFEKFRNDINIEIINSYITLLEYCYLNGGNFVLLLDKIIKMQISLNIKREKENQNNMSNKLMLLLIIIINFIIIKIFILSNIKYFNILTNTLIGKIILDINIISYILIVFIFFNLNKMED